MLDNCAFPSSGRAVLSGDLCEAGHILNYRRISGATTSLPSEAAGKGEKKGNQRAGRGVDMNRSKGSREGQRKKTWR